jgi:CDP-diacylglycerol--glycerol-3-phosphate 3-phosphatidyltransferase
MMLFLFSKGLSFKVLALVTFLLAALTDYLDGYFAKKMNDITQFGQLMDPIADKLLTIGAFLAFVEMELIPAWMVVIIVFREMLVTGLRFMALKNGSVLPAGKGGKHKTVSQMVSIFFILLFIVFKEAGERTFGFWNAGLEGWYQGVVFVLMMIAVIFTVLSGASYIVGNKKYLQGLHNGP